jgi:hypothetical protein
MCQQSNPVRCIPISIAGHRHRHNHLSASGRFSPFVRNGIEAFILLVDYVRFDIKKQCTSGQSDIDIANKIYD